MRSESENDLARQGSGVRGELDLAAIRRTLSRRRSWVFVPTALCFLAALVGVNVVEPRYTAESKILIENQENFFTRPDRGERETVQLPDDEAVQSQVPLVSSRDIARDAIKLLNLQGNPEFDPLAGGPGPVTRLLVLLGLERDPLQVASDERILTSYYDKLTVYPLVRSRVLSIQFTAHDPDLDAKAANTVSSLYINLQSDNKRASAHNAAESLATLIADIKVRAAAADTKAQEYRAQNGLLIGTNNTTITAQQLAEVSTQLGQARTAQADAQAKAQILRDMIRANRIGEVPDVANNDLVRRISDQRITLKTQIAQQSRTLLPGHPRMQELSAQLADLEQQMRAAAEKSVRTLENEAHIAAGRVDNLKAELDSQKQTATAASADEVSLRELESQARLLKDQLEFNTQKYQEAIARESAASTPADARIISRAVSPETPSFPKKGPMIAIFTLAGLVVSCGVLIGRELLSGRAFAVEPGARILPVQVAGMERDGDELARASFRPTLAGEGPSQRSELAREVASASSTNFSTVLNVIHAHRKAHGGDCVAVLGTGNETSVMPAALDLARTLASGSRTVLVDCGASTPGLTTLLGSRDGGEGTDLGLNDLLAGRATFAEVIHRDPLSRLHVVSTGSHTSLGGDTFDLVVDALAETYDHVVLAMPFSALSGRAVESGHRFDLAVLLVSPTLPRVSLDDTRAKLYAAGVPDVVAVDLGANSVAELARSAA